METPTVTYEREKHISDTAVLTAEARAAYAGISQDEYADAWASEGAFNRSFDDYSNEVASTEGLALSLRFRYFLEKAKSFLEKQENAVFVNFASGYTSYAFLLPESHTYVEIDLDDILKNKKEIVSRALKNGTLPARDIHFISCDFGREQDVKRLFKKLKKITGERKTFFLFEGILYYLNESAICNIVEQVKKVQVTGSHLALDTWPEDLEGTNVFKKFKVFAKKQFNLSQEFTLHSAEEVKRLDEYNLKDQRSYGEVSREFGVSFESGAEILREDFTLLEKK